MTSDPLTDFAIYSTETGAFSRLITCRVSQIQSQCQPMESYREAFPGLTTNRHRQNLDTGEVEEVAEELPSELETDRAHRDRLLAASDWTQTLDNRLTPEKRSAWAAVREEWRARIDDLKVGLPPRPWAPEPD